MTRYLFRYVDGQLACVPPKDIDPDGVNYLSLEDAAERSGIDEAILKARWERECGGIPVAKSTAAATKTIDELAQDRVASPLVFKVGTHVYRTFVTTEELIDNEGRPAMGRCVSSSADLILISSHFPPSTWKETWFHEVGHATEKHHPKSPNLEDDREWETTFTLASHEQFDEQGGLATLLSLKPITGVAPPHVCVPTKGASRDVLIRRKFAHLSEYQFDVAKNAWEEHKLNPWFNHFSVFVENGQVQLSLTFLGAMSVVMFADGFDSNPTRFFETEKNNRLPVSCTSTVRRTINGVLKTFTAEVLWSDIYGDDPSELSRIIVDYPRDSLGARADIRVLRIAFADVLGNLVIEDERRAPRAVRDAARTADRYRGRRG